MRTYRSALLRFAAAAAVLAASHAAAQAPPRRPGLPRGADTNDWQAYFDWGYQNFRNSPLEADRAFQWASRLDPSRAEPLFGQWAAYWYRNDGLFMAYLDGELKPDERREMERVDSLRYRALLRNPFVQRDLEVLIYERLPGDWARDAATQGILAAAQHQYPRALGLLGRAIATDPRKAWSLHEDRAIIFIALGRFDSATVEMTSLLEAARQQDRERLVRVYQSKDVYEYGLGMLHLARGSAAAGREALARALQENLALAPAHAALGQLALARGDTAAGFAELRQAVELAPHDAVLRIAFASALTHARRGPEAAEQARAAVAGEPDYAEGYLALASALDAAGSAADAANAYREYLARAPRRDTQKIAAATARLQALGSTTATSPAPSP
jgi:hypothetical protein